jgi:uncharacterized membrane protein YfcA
MVYVVGVPSAHVALGTSAVAVAANAAANLISHARMGNVRWRCAAIFSAAGIVGAWLGSTLGKLTDGESLLFLFALLMAFVGIMMFRTPKGDGDANATCRAESAPKTVAYGAGTGTLSGFFGIGGGFLIVPALMAASGMPILMAIGSSLVAVAAFGVTTAANYAISGYVDWPLAITFIAGGALGGIAGALAARRLASVRGALNTLFALALFLVAGFMLLHNAGAVLPV